MVVCIYGSKYNSIYGSMYMVVCIYDSKYIW